MKITVFIEREHKTRKVSLKGKTVRDLLQQLNLNSETVIIVRNNEVIIEQESLQDQDKIELLSVVSGG